MYIRTWSASRIARRARVYILYWYWYTVTVRRGTYVRIRILSWSWLMALLSWFKLRYLLGSIVHTCDDFDGCLGLANWGIKLVRVR